MPQTGPLVHRPEVFVEPAAAPAAAVAEPAPKVPRIANPRAIPSIGNDGHLPAIEPQRLTAEFLRACFSKRLDYADGWVPEISGDGRLSGRTPSPASVLVPLVQREDGLHVLLTRRSDQLRDHAGQVSFPGGRAEPFDADAAATALRETEEEVGLARAHVQVIGQMPVYTTVTSYVVTPVIALVQPPFTLALDRTEVDEAFEVPLQFLMSPQNHLRHVFSHEGGQRQFLSMPWTPPGSSQEYFIWGATAAMLRNLYSLLSR
jgi:8-oxo-dGTP pyrophosphatase MutT (NUDIX family)